MIEDGVPAFRLVNTSIDGRYRISKTVFSDPVREVVLQEIRFEALAGALSDYQVHAIVAPHLVNAGANNTGWCGNFKGHEMLFAEGRDKLSRSPPRCRGSPARPAMSGFPMAGRRCRAGKA